MKLYLMRHGETDNNKALVIMGVTNQPMNEKGISQAKAVAKAIEETDLRFNAIYSSPLLRAKQTAEILEYLSETPIQFDDRLQEINYGYYEGKSIPVYVHEAHDAFCAKKEDMPEKEMEHYDESLGRVESFLEEMSHKDEDDQVLAITHGDYLRGFLAYTLKSPREKYWDIECVVNCSAVVLEYKKDGGWSVVSYEEKFNSPLAPASNPYTY